MSALEINGQVIDDCSDCYVIAEIGHNHQGELEKAKEMFRRAKECGVDAVKLQKRDNRLLFTKAFYNKPYEHENSFGQTYGEHRDFLEFGREEYLQLLEYARELELTFFATAFDYNSADFLAELNMPAYKIASGDLKNIPLIKHIAAFGKPMLISTGGGAIADIRRVNDVLAGFSGGICYLQCTASYPTAPEDVNLNVIPALQKEFPDAVIGFSDHYNGIAMAEAAYLLGARVIEKHFTLNHTWKGTDHALSLEPPGMAKMVRDLRRVKAALGTSEKKIQECEKAALMKMSKSIVAARDLTAGTVIGIDDVCVKCPGNGLEPFRLDEVMGRTLSCDLAADQPLLADFLG